MGGQTGAQAGHDHVHWSHPPWFAGDGAGRGRPGSRSRSGPRPGSGPGPKLKRGASREGMCSHCESESPCRCRGLASLGARPAFPDWATGAGFRVAAAVAPAGPRRARPAGASPRLGGDRLVPSRRCAGWGAARLRLQSG
jgi:hypothetical protein